MSNSDFDLAESLTTTKASYFIFIYILVLIYCCFGLAVVCDVYFVPALQKLSYTYNLAPDIAGSTLMALGASVPELFASLIGVFVTEDDIGTGSIIGSSCFNLIAVPAACAFVASASFSRKLSISPIPVIRNSAFYAITILVLLLIIKDNKVDIPEAIILLLFFVMYMALMIVCAQSKTNTQEIGRSLQNSMNNSYTSNDSAIAECGNKHKTGDARNLASTNNMSNYQSNYNQNKQQIIYDRYYIDDTIRIQTQSIPTTTIEISERTPLVGLQNDANLLSGNRNNNIKSIPIIVAGSDSKCLDQNHNNLFNSRANLDSCSVDLGIAVKNSSILLKSTDNHSIEYNFDCHEDGWLNSYWVLLPLFPLTICLKFLTPLKFKNTCWTIWTFIVSIGLIGALTYVSVWMVHLFGQAIGMPETVAGMTILSWGTGIPELIASIVLIKKTAQADMAICNTIGSNVIDASFCLSLPWLIKCIMNKTAGESAEIEIQSAALPWTSFTLFLSVVILLLVLKFHNWELSNSVGVWLLVTYAAFVGVATYLESTYSKKGLDLLALI